MSGSRVFLQSSVRSNLTMGTKTHFVDITRKDIVLAVVRLSSHNVHTVCNVAFKIIASKAFGYENTTTENDCISFQLTQFQSCKAESRVKHHSFLSKFKQQPEEGRPPALLVRSDTSD